MLRAAAWMSPMYIVGTAVNTVAPCRTICASAWSGSNLGSRITAAPRRNAVFITDTWPNVWNRGRPPKTTSSRTMSNRSMRATLTCSMIARCEPTAPFGRPVVPLV